MDKNDDARTCKPNIITVKELYEKAIDERKNLLGNYNYWMNIYAIINGALFVGLYSNNGRKPFFTIGIPALGFVAGIAWYLFIKSYYAWIKSWITVISYYESKLICYSSSNTDEKNNEKVYLYRLFSGDGKPFSTQKISICFTFCVALLWGVSLLGVGVGEYEWKIRVYAIFIFILELFFLLFFAGSIQDSLQGTHKHLEQLSINKFAISDFNINEDVSNGKE